MASGSRATKPTTGASRIDRSFFDTNILIYADDADAGPKRNLALDLLNNHIRAGTAVLSTQILQEYYSVATRKLGISHEVARRKVELLGRLDLVQVDLDLILAAIDIQRLHSLSFWDALVVRSAVVSGCTVLLSEDLQDGRLIDGLRILNPFRV